MLTGTIWFEGSNLEECMLAIDEANKRISAGNSQGFDQNNESAFSFEIFGEEYFVDQKSEDL